MFSGAAEQAKENKTKFQEICNLLVAAGYFRARLTVLSNFDRIVGGMCWAITAAAVEVDVDVVFQENSTIGQKIKTSDQIVKSLRRMRCSYPLMSHQIQGLDYPSLFPVCQWLVLKVIENRRLTGDTVRQFSLEQFNKVLSLPEEEERREHEGSALPFVRSVMRTYTPQRRFRSNQTSFSTESSHVTSVLLEYGAKMKATVVDQSVADEDSVAARRRRSVKVRIGADGEIEKESGGGSKGAGLGSADPDDQIGLLAARLGLNREALDADAISSLTENLGVAASGLGSAAGGTHAQDEKDDSEMTEEDLEAKRRAEAALDKIKGQLAETSGDENEVKAASAGMLLGLQSEEIQEASAKAEAASRAAAGGASGPGGGGAATSQQTMLERQIKALKRQIAVEEDKTASARSSFEELRAAVDETKSKLAEKQQYNQRVVSEIEKLKARSAGQDQDKLAKLRGLVLLNEQLKQQEGDFRENCKRQLQELRGLMKEAEAGVSEEEQARMRQVDEMYAKDGEKFDKVKTAMSTKHQEIALLSRAMDDIPTRTELVQYERSFVELYEQVSAKLEETRRYYDQHNTLQQKRTFMEAQVGLLDSIHSWFKVPPKGNKARVLEALATYEQSSKQNLEKAEERLASEETARDKLKAKYNKLIEAQRRYYKIVKQFQDECTTNEKLAAKLPPEEQGQGP